MSFISIPHYLNFLLAGRNWSTDNITAALMRLVSMKLVIMETSGKMLSTLTRLSINVPTEDVKYALENQKAN